MVVVLSFLFSQNQCRFSRFICLVFVLKSKVDKNVMNAKSMKNRIGWILLREKNLKWESHYRASAYICASLVHLWCKSMMCIRQYKNLKWHTHTHTPTAVLTCIYHKLKRQKKKHTETHTNHVNETIKSVLVLFFAFQATFLVYFIGLKFWLIRCRSSRALSMREHIIIQKKRNKKNKPIRKITDCKSLIRLNHHQNPTKIQDKRLKEKVCHHEPEFYRNLYTFIYNKNINIHSNMPKKNGILG